MATEPGLLPMISGIGAPSPFVQYEPPHIFTVESYRAVMKTRRKVLAGIGAGSVGLLAGCLDIVRGNTLEYSSEPAQVDQSAIDDSGFEHVRTERIPVEDTVEAAGQERDVRITNWATSYNKRFNLERGGSIRTALFTTISTPDVEILSRSVNPITEMDHQEMIGEFSGEFDAIDEVADIQFLREDSTRMLGEQTEVSVFEATAIIEGREADALIHVADTQHEDDIVVAVGAYVVEFQGISLDESDNVRTFMQSVEHPADPPES